jgi:GNAT superfamily N-acetyltransferase
MSNVIVRRAHIEDSLRLKYLLREWLNWEPRSGRIRSIRGAIQDKQLLVAESISMVVGFIRFVLHEDVIDGTPNAFITAFYVQKRFRRKGIGTRLLNEVIMESAGRGATFVETSTIHSGARSFYEKSGFKQTMGEIGEIFLELDIKKHRGAQ